MKNRSGPVTAGLHVSKSPPSTSMSTISEVAHLPLICWIVPLKSSFPGRKRKGKDLPVLSLCLHVCSRSCPSMSSSWGGWHQGEHSWHQLLTPSWASKPTVCLLHGQTNCYLVRCKGHAMPPCLLPSSPQKKTGLGRIRPFYV